jgi:hypothetical protein
MGQNETKVRDSTPDIKSSKMEEDLSLEMNENKDKKLSKTMSRLSIGLILFWAG